MIHIIPDDEDIHVTEAEYAKYVDEYKRYISYAVNPMTLEQYIKTIKMQYLPNKFATDHLKKAFKAGCKWQREIQEIIET